MFLTRIAGRVAAALWLMNLPQGLAAPPLKGNSAFSQLGAISSEQKMCSQIGVDLLKAGGNAADAVVGTVFCIGVTAPYHAGIGGGGFMLIRSPNGEYEYVDFREVAAASYYTDMFHNKNDLSLHGGLAAAVPGEIRGLQHLHSKYGALPWNQVLAPAITLARNGWRVNHDQVKYFNHDNYKFLVDDPAWSVDFAPNGKLLGVNQIMTRKRYANTLQTIANEGPDAFYKGTIAKETIKALKAAGGTMTLEDLAKYKVALREPTKIMYRGYKLTACGAPAGGSVVLNILKIADGYSGFGDDALVNQTTHRINEAMKFSYGARTKLGDPAFVDKVLAYQAAMLSDEAAAKVRSLISDHTTHPAKYYNPENLEVLTDHGTSYITGFDASGLAIALTTTVNHLFGSRVMTAGGVVLNNQMNDFSIPGATNKFGYEPSVANYIKPGKRPLSSISPVIVEDGKTGRLYLATSCAGGSRIITQTVQSLHHVLDRKLTAADALAQPRLHNQLSPDTVSFEYAYDNSTVAYLKALGNQVSWVAPSLSSAGMVRVLPNGKFEAASDPRQKNSGGLVAERTR